MTRTPLSKQRNKHIQRVLVEAAKLAHRQDHDLALVYETAKQKGNGNRATLAVARKMVEYLLAVDRGQRNFVPAEAPTDAQKQRELAQALDPAHDYYANAGIQRVGRRNLEQERRALEEKAPNDPFAIAVMAKDYAIGDRYKESVEMWERSLALYGWQEFVNVLRRANRKGGPKFALEQWMRACEEYSKTHDDSSVVALAFTYSSLGNKDRAFAWLDKAVEQRSWIILYLKNDDVWRPLRSDPRFKVLLRRVGLPP